jgi:LmbE family N-acetylglucosaminyl deacetylase
MLFIPYVTDAHPDHVAASQIALAARFYGKLTKTAMAHEPHFTPRVFRYMAVHQRVVADPSFVVDISGDIKVKLDALRAYESQFVANEKNAGVIPMMESMARTWGALSGVEAGEPFFALEPIALSSPADVL